MLKECVREGEIESREETLRLIWNEASDDRS